MSAPAFVYVSARLRDALRQPVWGWWSQTDQFAMGPAYQAAPGMARYMTGTPTILGLVAVEEGARLLLEAGVAAIRDKSVLLTEYLIQLAEASLVPRGCAIATPRDPARRGGHVTFTHPRAEPIVAGLGRRGVVADFRTPERFRFGLSPLTTRYTDVWQAVEATRELLVSSSR